MLTYKSGVDIILELTAQACIVPIYYPQKIFQKRVDAKLGDHCIQLIDGRPGPQGLGGDAPKLQSWKLSEPVASDNSSSSYLHHRKGSSFWL